MIEKHEIENSRVYLQDCMEGMKQFPDKYFDLAVVDPPYGININANMGLRKHQKKRHKNVYWDDKIPSKEYFSELSRISKNQIIWGGQYFPTIWTRGCNHFIFWDKQTPVGMSFSDGELAWTSFSGANRKFTFYNITNNKIHPTQKPVALYDWIFQNYAKPGMKIIDTHLGSQSSRIAADKYKMNFTGFELDPDYFREGNKRFEIYKAQLKLF